MFCSRPYPEVDLSAPSFLVSTLLSVIAEMVLRYLHTIHAQQWRVLVRQRRLGVCVFFTVMYSERFQNPSANISYLKAYLSVRM